MSVEIRDLQGMAEFAQAEQLQRDVWGAGDAPDPADLMMVVQHEGGLVAGAFAEGRLLGYAFGFPTRDPLVQHSHRLAVRAEARGLKLGLRLKWYQHDWCAARGIARVRWTYDPLRLANATLNIAALGAEVSTYLPDYYGEMAGINAGTASDRLMADWHVGSPRVQASRAGQAVLTCRPDRTGPPGADPAGVRNPAGHRARRRAGRAAADARGPDHRLCRGVRDPRAGS
ncbi:MAG: GNAT family N-acetyltransferase [Gemmobacter sp.]|nr:GNAT family N-acetyltransferase [Gemmobacter sp.]